MNFEVLLEKPKDKIIFGIFLLTFILTIIFIMFIFPPLLSQFPPGAGLMDMKFAWNKKNMDKVIRIWKKSSLSYYVKLMIIVHLIDFVFMVLYGLAIFTGLLMVARQLEYSEKLQNFYLKLSIVSWLSVIFDVVEGIFIFIILFNPNNITDFTAFGVGFSTTMCMLILYSCIIIWIIGLFIVLIHYFKGKLKKNF